MTYPYVAGAVLLAADLNTDFASKTDTAPTQNTQTGTGASAYTFVLADASRLTVANAATAATYTIPPSASVVWVANTIINVTSIGAGTITFAAGAGVTVTNTAGTLAQYQAAMLVRTALNAWTVVPFAGGASLLKVADVSATTGSPSITTSGIYTIYEWTGSGSITLTKAGLADCVLAAGGGGGGASGDSGGGGGGGTLANKAYLPSGTHTITVGGSGAVGTSGTNTYLGPYGMVGGGGGGADSTAGLSGGSSGGSGNTAATVGSPILGQGNTGGLSVTDANNSGGGGGGAGAAGATTTNTNGGNGGAGVESLITGSSVFFGGGGGGGSRSATAGTGGSSVGGKGQDGTAAGTGVANRGGGGGGAKQAGAGAAGGSGIVRVRVLT